MDIETANGAALLVASVFAIGAGISGLVAFVWRIFKRLDRIDRVTRELEPNSGESVKDHAAQTRDELRELTRRFAALVERDEARHLQQQVEIAFIRDELGLVRERQAGLIRGLQEAGELRAIRDEPPPEP